MFVNYADVSAALENDQVIPFFQPIVDLRSGRLFGFEVLARWQHPLLGPILPKNFIPLAEENGLIEQLTEQIFRKAFISSPILPEPIVLAVNVSPMQLHDLTLPCQIREATEAAGFPLQRLTIEITESALLDNLVLARKIAYELKAMGCRLALDDFGTGYSSLRHLQALPFDELKIDRSFVKNMTSTRESRKIVAAIVGLGHSLDLITVAEGIETKVQAEMLLCLGCKLGQGWLYGKPSSADAIPGMVASKRRARVSRVSKPGERTGASSLEALPTQRLAQLQAIYDGAPVGLCFLDRNLHYVSINRRLAEMNGVPVVDHIGRAGKEMFPEWFPNYEPYLCRALQGEAMTGVEVLRPSRRLDLPDMITMASYQPAWDEAGEVIGVSIAVADITDHKRAQEAIREIEDSQRFIFDLNPHVQWIMDNEGNNLQINSRWEQATGLSKEKTRNMGWLDALHPEDVAPTMTALKEALSTGNPIDVEYRIKSVDGMWRWMRSRGSPRRGPLGEIIRWYGSVEDIQEHRHADEARRKSIARMLGSFDEAPTSVMTAGDIIKRRDDDGTNPRQVGELWH
jgi:PAS domain S-box-containing protein